MTDGQWQADILPTHEPLGPRLREVGMVLVVCDLSGTLEWRPPVEADWLTDLCCNSPLINAALSNATAAWNDQASPQPFEGPPGLWFAPVALMRRRSRNGYAVAIIPTRELLDSAYLPTLCQTARLDEQLCRTMLEAMTLPPASELPRVASFVQMLHGDRAQMVADEQALDNVGQQLAWSYEEINLLYSITRGMTVVERPDRFIRMVCDELLETLPYQWIGAIFRRDEEVLHGQAGRLVVAGDKAPPLDRLRVFGSRLLAKAEIGKSIVIDSEILPWFEDEPRFGRTIIAHPVTTKGEVTGLLMAGDKRGDDHHASSMDTKLLGATAAHVAIFLENALLFENLNNMFVGTLEALTASIDAKDRYTCGHSRRVAYITQELARQIGLDEKMIARMHIAGLVHDVGKIGVPEHVLLKPGRLTEDEFAWIRRHPEMGHKILKDISALSDVLPGVLYHHERWDGKGYPAGLKGDEIPLCARLICLADSFDAMSSTRTYREARSREEVLEEIARCAGSQFDPELALIFSQIDFAEYDRLVEEHRAQDRRSEENAP